MRLIPPEQIAALRANDRKRLAAMAAGASIPDPVPLVRLFNPCGAASWLAVELARDGDTLFGLADLGFGYPEPGCFSLREIAAVRLPFGLRILRDPGFATRFPFSVWLDAAQLTGGIVGAQRLLEFVGSATARRDPELPPSGNGGG